MEFPRYQTRTRPALAPLALYSPAPPGTSPPYPSPPLRSGRDYQSSKTFPISEECGCYSPGGKQPLYPVFDNAKPSNREDIANGYGMRKSSNSGQVASAAQPGTHPSITAAFSFLQNTSTAGVLDVTMTTKGGVSTNKKS
jgi:hypothetical protein